MIRKLMFTLAFLAVVGFAAGQVVEVTPTLGDGDEAIAKNTGPTDAEASEASVEQRVELLLPKATALHLAATTITFDLEALDGAEWGLRATGDSAAEALDATDFACVYVSGGDVVSTLDGEFWSQTQVVPGGIAYARYGGEDWDKIKLVYFGNGESGDVDPDQIVTTYPPIRIDNNGLVTGSKDYFVCYQTFVIQLFSNFENFRLQVSRLDTPVGDEHSINHLYVQGNTCAETAAETGLYDLPNGENGVATVRDLLPRSLTVGPTGFRSADSTSCNANSSWLDVLGVLAVKVNADLYGTSVANLTYTLGSSNDEF